MVGAIIAFVVAIAIAIGVLGRQRARTRPSHAVTDPISSGRRMSRREKLLARLEPPPEIPSVIDLMIEELAETGVETFPGHEGLPGPIMLKVFRRDESVRLRCTHDAYGFVVAPGVAPDAATVDDVTLYCDRCGPANGEGTTDSGIPDEEVE